LTLLAIFAEKQRFFEAMHIDPMESLFVYLSACGARSAMLSNEYNSNRFDGL